LVIKTSCNLIAWRFFYQHILEHPSGRCPVE
jgi:hypothetical protein